MIHHTKPSQVAVVSWETLDDSWEISSPALIDTGAARPPGRPLFARLNYDEALLVAGVLGGELMGPEHFETLRRNATVTLHPFLGTPRAENGIEHSIAHDEYVWDALLAQGWYAGRGPVAGAGKHWIAGAPLGRSRLVGWDKDGDGPGQALWQPDSVAHNRQHFDDGTTTLIVRRRRPPTKPKDPDMHQEIVRLGSKGEAVKAWQRVLGVSVDGVFGPKTEAATRAWQAARGLTPDGIVGAKSWAAVAAKPVLDYEPAKRTPVTPAEMYGALEGAWIVKFGTEPTRASLLVLLAQSGIETNDWRSMWNFNVGNVKRVKGYPWMMLAHVWEIIGGKREVFEPPHPQTHFRAFPDLEAGVAAYLDTMAGRFAKSWQAVLEGDPEAFARALKAQSYFTAPVDAYAKALSARFRAFNLSIPIEG